MRAPTRGACAQTDYLTIQGGVDFPSELLAPTKRSNPDKGAGKDARRDSKRLKGGRLDLSRLDAMARDEAAGGRRKPDDEEDDEEDDEAAAEAGEGGRRETAMSDEEEDSQDEDEGLFNEDDYGGFGSENDDDFGGDSGGEGEGPNY